MDIINSIPDKDFHTYDELLAYLSIYDDEERTRAYKKMLRDNRHLIENKVCLEAGCGLGIFSEYMCELGAARVYAVEANELIYSIAAERLRNHDNIIPVHSRIEDFLPSEPVDLLLHELYGQMLYDEYLISLSRLKFKAGHVIPARGELVCGCCNLADMDDPVITPLIMEKLSSVLVSSMFDEEALKLSVPVCSWEFGKEFSSGITDISALQGDLLYFGIHIIHNNQIICRSGECGNWSYIWTPRIADRFSLAYVPGEELMDIRFKWLPE